MDPVDLSVIYRVPSLGGKQLNRSQGENKCKLTYWIARPEISGPLVDIVRNSFPVLDNTNTVPSLTLSVKPQGSKKFSALRKTR